MLTQIGRIAQRQSLGTPGVGNVRYVYADVARAGLKALGFVPLISHNRAIGTFNLGRLRDDPFTEGELHFLGQVASQIALAVENTCTYNEITRARAELEKALEEI
jgi:GAF domain-containing protein